MDCKLWCLGRSFFCSVSGPTITGSLGWNSTNPQRIGCQQQRWDGGETTQSLSVAGMERNKHTFPFRVCVFIELPIYKRKSCFWIGKKNIHEFPLVSLRLRLVGFDFLNFPRHGNLMPHQAHGLRWMARWDFAVFGCRCGCELRFVDRKSNPSSYDCQ